MSAEDAGPTIACPACGAALYGWAVVTVPGGSEVVFDHCEDCGLIVTRAPGPVDVASELAALARGPGEYVGPNRRSTQAALGGGEWAALDPARRLHLTPKSAELLLSGLGLEVNSIGFTRAGRNVGWMWQTLMNGLTFNRNFATRVAAKRMAPRGRRELVQYSIDWMVTVLAAIPVAVIALPLELAAATARRGGEMVIEARPRPREESNRAPLYHRQDG